MTDDTDIVDPTNNMISDFAKGTSLAVSENLASDLKTFAEKGDRKEVLSRIKDLFIASRAEANTLSENVRSHALKILENKLGDMSTPQLIRVIDLLTTANQNDVAAILGVPMGGKGVSVNINSQSNSQTLIQQPAGGDPTRNPLQDAQDILEGITLIANRFKVQEAENPRMIDVTPKPIEDETK